MIIRFIILVIILVQIKNDKTKLDWDDFSTRVLTEYQSLEIADLYINYVDNLNNIRAISEILKQEEFFKETEIKLHLFTRSELKEAQQIEFDLIQYFTALHLERIGLEKQWIEVKPGDLSQEGLMHVPLGKEWYRHFLHRWIDMEVDPDALFEFGLKEVDKVKECIRQIQIKSGLSEVEFYNFIESDTFYIKEPIEIKKAFRAFDAKIKNKLSAYFPGFESVPEVEIKEGETNDLAQVPGFYRNNTFYYNHFGKPFNRRQIKWLYMHEANPGHHYEVSRRREVSRTPLQNIFRSLGYAEGWAAYIEEIGCDIGAYENIYDELGKWEWDIIRSVRVPLDVGLNYYNWDDEKALAFWKTHIKGKDDIGLREIARMKRWPCQVITYKYGANKILDWKEKLMGEHKLDYLEFHTAVLQYGPLPFSILNNYLHNEFQLK